MSQPPDPAGAAPGFQVVRLITLGARSGAAREVELWAHGSERGLFLVGSNWGKPQHAAWYWNVLANPAVTLVIGSAQQRMRARVADKEERDRLFAVAARNFPRYREFATTARREIPIVVLEPGA